MRTEVWLPLTRRNGGMSRVRTSSQAIYNGAETVPFLGTGSVLIKATNHEE